METGVACPPSPREKGRSRARITGTWLGIDDISAEYDSLPVEGVTFVGPLETISSGGLLPDCRDLEGALPKLVV